VAGDEALLADLPRLSVQRTSEEGVPILHYIAPAAENNDASEGDSAAE
jgi:hypothetical protein